MRTPWYGNVVGYRNVDGIQVGGERWTTQQAAAILHRGLDPLTCEAMEVRRQAVNAEIWIPVDTLPAVFAFDCPIIKRMAGDKVKVIAPDGQPKIVFADGWGHRPFRRPRQPDDGFYQDRILGAGGSGSRPIFSTTRKAIR
ncbi:hypothetical protein GCM10020258_46260 [Sphingomonas yabuuchiae]